MKVCVVGSGGREHALAIAIGRTADVVVTPGNPGIPGVTPEGHSITISGSPATEIDADLFVIGPEAPLVDGLADRLRAKGRVVFGPGADGARLEGSKAYMKDVLSEAGVPTARHGAFSDRHEAVDFLHTLPGPWVVKTDGLASGKGVLVADSLEEAEADVVSKLSGEAFGEAGRLVVIEEGLVGAECSLHVLCDGSRVLPLAPARDFKRVGDADAGPNTGGMGSDSPVPFVDEDVIDRVMDRCVDPLVAALRRRGVDYRGVLYAGLMLTDDGPKVLEYNVRFGDPETQVIVQRTPGDLAGLLFETAQGHLRTVAPPTEGASVCVVLASEGYPGAMRTGDRIFGLDQARWVKGVTVVSAGVASAIPGTDGAGTDALVTAGGRVLGVTGVGDTLSEARKLAYEAVACIRWEGMHHRHDIAELDAAALDGIGARSRATGGPNKGGPNKGGPNEGGPNEGGPP
jgi:phosphoribosylamine---glycine ligase